MRTTESLGDEVHLCMDVLFLVKSTRTLTYEWSFNSLKISKDDKHYRGSDTRSLYIEHFESQCEGKYKCVVSTTSQPKVSTSAEFQLDLHGQICSDKYNTFNHFIIITDHCQEFHYEMEPQDFLTFLNVKGIPYKVCKVLQGK